jgi:threonine dehydratase
VDRGADCQADLFTLTAPVLGGRGATVASRREYAIARGLSQHRIRGAAKDGGQFRACRVAKAAEALRSLFPPTPLQENATICREDRRAGLLKREDLTPVRSYKIRGAFTFFRKALARPARAGCVRLRLGRQSCARIRFRLPPFRPQGRGLHAGDDAAAEDRQDAHFGGEFIEIRLVGDFFDDCYRAALAFAEESGGMMVPPFDHRTSSRVRRPSPGDRGAMPKGRVADIVIMPVGGGGLGAGVTQYFSQTGWPRFVFVEPAGAPSLKTALAVTGKRAKLARVDNFVDGAAVAEIGKEPLRHLSAFAPDSVRLIPENRLCATMIEMLNIEGVVLEPAGALSIDALKDFSRKGAARQDGHLRRLGRQFRL